MVCGRCLSFGALGLLPTLRCLFCFLFGCFAPLLCLSSSWWLWLAIVLCCWLLLLVFPFWAPCGFCPAWGVSGLAVGVGVFLIGVLGPGLSPFVFVVVIGVSFLALWDFCPPCGVRLPPLSGCGLGLFVFRLFGASARSGVFIFPLVVVVGTLGLLPALWCFLSLLVAVLGICPSVPVPCWFRLLGPFFPSLVWAT